MEQSSNGSQNDIVMVAINIIRMVQILNEKLKERGWNPIQVGIGIDTGRALMVQAGYEDIKDVIWMGDVVNTACHLANESGRNDRIPICISPRIYDTLVGSMKMFFTPIPTESIIEKYEFAYTANS